MQKSDELEIAKWFLTRSDSLRASLSTRSSLVVASNAFLLTSIGFIISNYRSELIVNQFKLIIIIALIFISASVVFAIMAAIKIRPSKIEAEYIGPKRIFLNPKDTFENFNSVEEFKDCLKADESEKVLNSICGELLVDLKIQQKKYKYQRASMIMLLPAFMITIFALVLAL